MKSDYTFMCHWFPSNSGYYSNASVLPFVLNSDVFFFFSKSSETLHNKNFKVCSTHISLAADEVSRKFIVDGFE